jgi:formylglycine-generating enzyme required for sulfatase activity
MSRSAILDEISFSTNPCCTPSRWFGAVQRPLAVLAAVSTVALAVTAFGQAPVASGVGSDSSRRQVESVSKSLPATPERFVTANVAPLIVGGLMDLITKETSEGEVHLARKSFSMSSEVSAAPCGSVSDISPSALPKPLSAVEECSLKPKDAFKECERCPEMIVVPAGKFNMGSPEDEPERNKNEGPQHIVQFARQFAVGRFAVTFDEWDACVADGGCDGYKPNDNGWGHGNRPVIHVSWSDAQAYVAWLSNTTGKTYRLLSEAEREYVTRGGTTTPFWFGSTISLEQANFDDKHPYNSSPPGGRRGETLPVDSFLPNPWGLYQVHGNVWDWVADCFNDSYVGAPSDGSAWMSGDCGKHVLRGGSWIDQPRFLRSAFRLRDVTSRRYNLQGFRVARPLNP